MSNQANRVYVVELEPGDITIFDEVVERVDRVTDSRTLIHMSNGHVSAYSKAYSTILIKNREA